MSFCVILFRVMFFCEILFDFFFFQDKKMDFAMCVFSIASNTEDIIRFRDYVFNFHVSVKR